MLKAHKILMSDLVDVSGKYRNKNIGIFQNGTSLIHMGARPQFIQQNMTELFNWVKKTDIHPLIKSCIFHYELEFIHPFEDGKEERVDYDKVLYFVIEMKFFNDYLLKL